MYASGHEKGAAVLYSLYAVYKAIEDFRQGSLYYESRASILTQSRGIIAHTYICGHLLSAVLPAASGRIDKSTNHVSLRQCEATGVAEYTTYLH